MKRFHCLLASALLLLLPLTASGATPAFNHWSSSGPFKTGLGNRVITTLAVSPDNGTVYAGTGSGSVFSYVIKQPALTVTISGSGSVTSNNGAGTNDTCSKAGSGTCDPVTFSPGDTVTLTAIGSNSGFSAWGGADYTNDPSVNPGSILMSGDKAVTATFTANPAKVVIQGSATPYYTIGAALGAAPAPLSPALFTEIRVLAGDFAETVTMTNINSLKLRGGFTDAGFIDNSQTGYSTISGWLKVQAGKLTVERVRIK